MGEIRTTASKVQAGDILVSAGRGAVNSRVNAVGTVDAGTKLTGARGGQYVVNANGAASLIRLTLATGRALAVTPTTTVVVFRQSDDW